MRVIELMIHPNNGKPKFWALNHGGSCIFGSLVKRGVKTSQNAGEASEKFRKGYRSVLLPALTFQSDIEAFAALSVGSISYDSATKITVKQLIVNANDMANIHQIDLSATMLPRLSAVIGVGGWGKVPTDDPAPVAPQKRIPKEFSVFSKGFTQSDQDYLF